MRQASATVRGRNGFSWLLRTLLFVLVFTGCAPLEEKLLDTPTCNAGCDDMSTRLGREVVLNQKWQNRRFSELKAALGQPRLIMNIPGGGNPPGFVAVYGADPVTGCIDAFAFIPSSDPIVRVYHCR